MSRNGSGTYNLPAGNPVVTGTTITTSWANTTLNDIASALTGSIAADGQTPMSGSLNMANNKVISVTDPTNAQDAATKAYVDAADTTNLALTLLKANNLSDVASASTSRTNLGLGTIATQAASSIAVTGGAIDGTTVGTTTRSSIKANTLDLGLSTQSVAIGQGDASAMKNRLINGAMVIDQRNAGASSTPAASGYLVDRFGWAGSIGSKLTFGQNLNSVTTPTGFTKYLGAQTASATTPGASEYYGLYQVIEGYNIADLGWGTANAKTITLSFQVYSSLTGTFGGSIYNGAANRCYPISYSIPVANTWTTISITIAGDTTGTWATDNTSGLIIFFSLGAGATVSGTAGAWGSTLYRSSTGAVQVVANASATFYITGVQLEVGSSATGFEYRQYGTEYSLCQRYFQKVGSNFSGATTTGNYEINVPFYFPMRTSPTITVGANTYFNVRYTNSSGTAGDYANLNPVLANTQSSSYGLWTQVVVGGTTGGYIIVGRQQYPDTGNFINASAEL